MDKEITISRLLPSMQEILQNDPTKFLRELRNSVRQIRAEEPQLAAYQIRDLGLIRRDDGLEIKLYFSQAN